MGDEENPFFRFVIQAISRVGFSVYNPNMSLYSTVMTYLHDIITEIAQIRQHQEYVLVVQYIVMCLFLRENNRYLSNSSRVCSRYFPDGIYILGMVNVVLFYFTLKSKAAVRFQQKSQNNIHNTFLHTYVHKVHILTNYYWHLVVVLNMCF